MQIAQDFGGASIEMPGALASDDASAPPTPTSVALEDGITHSPVLDRTPVKQEDTNNAPRTKPKQKRNKPTLSCLECGTSSTSLFPHPDPSLTTTSQSNERPNVIARDHVLLASNVSRLVNTQQ